MTEIVETISTGRSPIVILQNPGVPDFVEALNYFVTATEICIAKEERERLERLEREALAAEAARLEKERQAAISELLRQKELERKRQSKQIQEERRLRQRQNADLPSIKRPKTTSYTGPTTRSHCHGSRELYDYAISTWFEIFFL